MKDSILGKRYSLSIAFVTPAKIKSLNIQYRKHNESTDILSFGLGEDSGELYFSMSDVARKARTFNKTTAQYFKYLVVHGLLHLKGHVHGKEMDALEKKYCKRTC
jgi:probable rRNA maturation factor